MKKLLYLILTCAFVFNSTLAQEIKNYSEKELIIKLNSDVEFDSENCLTTQKFNNNIIDALNNAAFVESFRATGNKKIGRTFLLKIKYKSNINQLIEDYMNTGLFEFVEPNYREKGTLAKPLADALRTTPNDEHYYNRQWYHYNDGTFPLSSSTVDSDMDTDLAWDITQGDANITVAILDSGLKLDHPEFAGREWINSDEVQDGTDTDGNGYIDDLNWGWDFGDDDDNPTDEHWHGTAITGVVLATGNNDIGFAGMDWNAKIMVCKARSSDGSIHYDKVADAIYYAVDNGANVINASIGLSNDSSLVRNAVNYAYDHNVFVVAAAGNGNCNCIVYPAKYENALAIGSTDPDDTRSVPFDGGSAGSNYGPELDFVAPGNYIYVMDHTSNTNYEIHGGGTSASAPMVTGLISLLLSISPTLTVNDIRATLEASSEDEVGDSEDTPGWDQYYGHGRINAYDAVTNIILGIEENTNLENNIIVYPNPATNLLTISSKNETISQVTIFNVLGQHVMNKTFSNNFSETFDVTNLNSGIYTIKINQNTTKRLIKN